MAPRNTKPVGGWRTPLGLIVIAGALALPAMARAAPLTVTQAQSLGVVQQREATLPQPHSTAEVLSQQAQVQPMVDKVVAQANATGNGAAVQALINNTSSPGEAAVHAAILKDSPSVNATSTGTPPSVGAPLGGASAASVRHHSRAHAAGCGGNGTVWNENGWGGFWIAGQIYIVSNGWCGNGYSITWFGGFRFSTYTGIGYCWANGPNYDSGSWIYYWSWTHGGIWAQLGIGVSWGCIIPGDWHAATLREAANGYWDRLY